MKVVKIKRISILDLPICSGLFSFLENSLIEFHESMNRRYLLLKGEEGRTFERIKKNAEEEEKGRRDADGKSLELEENAWTKETVEMGKVEGQGRADGSNSGL